MATRRMSEDAPKPRRRPPATTPEERENEMISLAVDAAERMLLEPNPPAQIVTHYLRLGSSTEKLEQLKKRAEVDLLEKRAAIVDATQHMEELYREAIDAFRNYRSSAVDDREEWEEDGN